MMHPSGAELNRFVVQVLHDVVHPVHLATISHGPREQAAGWERETLIPRSEGTDKRLDVSLSAFNLGQLKRARLSFLLTARDASHL